MFLYTKILVKNNKTSGKKKRKAIGSNERGKKKKKAWQITAWIKLLQILLFRQLRRAWSVEHAVSGMGRGEKKYTKDLEVWNIPEKFSFPFLWQSVVV